MAEISFLIATKNRGHLIRDTLNSLLSQDIDEWEAVIVDDHGSDDTKEIVESYKEDRFRYFYLSDTHGHGASCARNFGILFSNSEIIAILDSDDLAYPSRARVTVDAFENDPKLDVFYSSFDIWDEKTGEVHERIDPPVYDFSLEKMKKLNYIPHCTMAIKRNILILHPYNQYFKIAEDYEITSRLAVLGKKFTFSPERLTKYRYSDENMHRGEGKGELTHLYDNLVKMVRGWKRFEKSTLLKIEEIENKKEDDKS